MTALKDWAGIIAVAAVIAVYLVLVSQASDLTEAAVRKIKERAGSWLSARR